MTLIEAQNIKLSVEAHTVTQWVEAGGFSGI